MEESVSYSLSLFLSVNLLFRSPMCGHGPRHVGFLLILCQAQKWASGSKAEQLAHEVVSIRDASTTGGSLICYASVLVPGSIFLKPKIFTFIKERITENQTARERDVATGSSSEMPATSWPQEPLTQAVLCCLLGTSAGSRTQSRGSTTLALQCERQAFPTIG